jgi:hypothetical protein
METMSDEQLATHCEVLFRTNDAQAKRLVDERLRKNGHSDFILKYADFRAKLKLLRPIVTAPVAVCETACAKPSVGTFRRQILLVGGIGRMAPEYRQLVEGYGYELMFCEQRIPRGTPPTNLAAVIVVASVVSHPMRETAAKIAEIRAVPIAYLRAPSLSAVRLAIEGSCGKESVQQA